MASAASSASFPAKDVSTQSVVAAPRLADYREQLAAFSSDDAEAFYFLLQQGMDLLDLRSVDLCEQFDVTKPSVRHWREGHSAPHPAVRELVIGYLAKCAEAQGAPVPMGYITSTTA